ncbi:MFS general substrate transporter [Laetiporus sulphureus 93-53]|uniref:MFS general substrate transporter n=1 Tax=Laetiporus sulphureus 93-53 TaxID=1314785 RepID=A0A165D2Q7_9APHY|nr:MFS general substrate transporter [Laetiporus sulphureus 93-53]KZT04040.1 MFS general substrate transporter [Laetiporus sulphureus 93-53]
MESTHPQSPSSSSFTRPNSLSTLPKEHEENQAESHSRASVADSHSPTIVDDLEEEALAEDEVQSEFHLEAYGPHPGEKGWDSFEVTIPLDDPENPKSWSRPYRWYLTMLGSVLVFNATFASSAPEGIVFELMDYFTFSEEVVTLTIALFVGGYCVGPILWGPLSEQFGRRIIFIITFAVYVCFQVGCALSRNTGSILVFRFLSGTFAAAPLSNSGALVSDIWDAGTRGEALAFFTLAPFAGPTLGPIVSGFMSVRGVSWRWLFWLLTLFAGFCMMLTVFTLPETFLPILMVRKAQRLRKETGDDRYWAPLERQKKSFGEHMKHILARPFLILFREPMLMAITMYMSFVYGCIYLLFEAYPIVFIEGHHLSMGLFGLTFLPIFLGACAGVFFYLLIFNPRYVRSQHRHAPHPVPPEERLEVAMFAAPMFAGAFFWFGWTSYPNVSLWAPLVAGFPLGWSVVWIFLALFNYVIDAYLFVAASALAALTVVRSFFGAGFPMFAAQMYNRLNARWASTLIGCLAVLMAPIPFVLYAYGPHIRKKSKYAPTRAATPVLEKPEEDVADKKKTGDNVANNV